MSGLFYLANTFLFLCSYTHNIADRSKIYLSVPCFTSVLSYTHHQQKMVYDPTLNPSNQIGVASVTYKGEAWVFYYESSGDLYVLRGAEGNKYQKS